MPWVVDRRMLVLPGPIDKDLTRPLGIQENWNITEDGPSLRAYAE
jgi:hypothetical protein